MEEAEAFSELLVYCTVWRGLIELEDRCGGRKVTEVSPQKEAGTDHMGLHSGILENHTPEIIATVWSQYLALEPILLRTLLPGSPKGWDCGLIPGILTEETHGQIPCFKKITQAAQWLVG